MDGLKILTDGDGKPRSKFWYTRFTRNGEKVDVSLAVPIMGEPPRGADGLIDLSATGDPAFEKSRKAALSALARMRAAASTVGETKAVRDAKTADLVNRYHRARTGRAIKSPRLDALPGLWTGLKRNYKPTAERTKAAERTFKRFAKFAGDYCQENGGKCETVDEITPELAAAWFREISAEYSWGTVRPWWNLLSTSWRRWHVYTNTNPFENVVIRNREASAQKVERRPLTEAELSRLFKVTKEDPELHGLVVAAACTGMRIGDVCRLKWADVDFKRGMIDCMTAKAGVKVTVPIFPPLLKVLKSLHQRHAVGDSPFVWPRLALKYDSVNKDGLRANTGLYRAVKPYFAKAIFSGDEPAPAVLADKKPMSREEVLAAIDSAGFAPSKKERCREVYTRFNGGEKYAAIAEALGIARGQVSDYLGAVEALTGESYRPHGERVDKNSKRFWTKKTRGERAHGKVAASLFGWHNLRHSFIIIALAAGVPINDVSSIVGHGDVSTTLKNYGNSSREVVAERLARSMKNTVIGMGEPVPAIEAEEAKPTALPAPTPSPAPKTTKERLAELQELFDGGLITELVYERKQTEILASL